LKATARALVRGLLWVLLCVSPQTCLGSQQEPSTETVPGQTTAEDGRAAFEPSPDDVARVIAPNSATRYEGLRVRNIEFRGVPVADPERLRAMLPQQVNQPLNRNKLKESIQALFQTGKFSDVKVQAERAPNAEVTLVFVAKENYFVGGVSIVGTPHAPPTYNQLISSTKLQLGELFTQEKLERATARMKHTLEDNGYYRSVIAPQLKRHPEIQQVDIVFYIDAGKLARIGQVIVRGNPGYSVTEIQHIAKLQTGEKVSGPKTTRALERLRKRYQKKDRLEAQVSLLERLYHSDSNTVDYVFHIERGPTVDVRLEGADLRKGLLKRYIPIYEEAAVDDDLLNEGRRNLRDYFQTKGYFEADIDFYQQSQDDHRNVIYDVNRGPKHKLVAIDIEGSRYFPEEEIRERLKIKPAGILLRYGLFSQTMLSRDVDTIENMYRNNGFQKISVKADVQDDYKGEIGAIRVLMHIDEGPQTLVSSLKIVGNSEFSEEEIRSLMINGTEGQPFSDTTLAADRDSVLTFYFNRGFPNAQFEYSVKESSSDPPRMDVVYKLTEGTQVFVDRVLISGLNHTKPWIVTRELDIHDDDPLNQSAMLSTQTRLYDLGIFNEIDIAAQNPDGQAPAKNVLLQVEEARRYTFNYGVGLEVQTGSTPGSAEPQGRTGVSPRVSFDVTRLNFLGRNHTITLKTRFGRLQQRALLSYEFPWFLNRPNWKLTFTTFYDTTRDVRTFTAERLEGSIQAQQKWSKASTLLYRFTYRRVKVDPNSLAIDPNLIPLLSKPVRVGMPGLTYIYDTRDDPTDSHRGNYSTIDLGASSGIFGSEASFSRVLFSNTTYHQFRSRKWVLARSTRLGTERPFGSSTFIPLPERFFAGGGNSHRGFAINQAGPRDLQTGFPLGGESMFVNQTELRFQPLQLPFIGENLSPVLFHDMGNVFASTGKIFRSLIKVSQNSTARCEQMPAAACDFNYLGHAVGVGFRYRTPIGRVRVDFGYNLNPPTFPVNRENRFETLNHFNFYFSIGQTF
jgi:outer membrane protein assembly complex protein YaeT